MAVGLFVIGATSLGSCVYDFAAATLQLTEVTIIDKSHQPGYYREDCTNNSSGRQRCEKRWVSDEWSVWYSDGTGHALTVNPETYERLQRGDRKWIRYYRGAWWGIRYSTTILDQPPSPESGK